MVTATKRYINMLEELLKQTLLPSQKHTCKLAIIILKYLSEMDYYVQDIVDDLEGMIPPESHQELLDVFSQKDLLTQASDITVQIKGSMDQPKVFAKKIEEFLEEHKDVFDGKGTASIEIQQPMTRH